MTRMASVTVLRRHSNEFGGVLAKVPPAELGERDDALGAYALPLGQAERLEREVLVRIDNIDPDPDAEPEVKPELKPEVKPAKAGGAGKAAKALRDD